MPDRMVNILGISGSPRQDGNTDILVGEALRILGERTRGATRFVRIADCLITPCRGCRMCMQLGRCVIHGDDFEDIMGLVTSADLLVLGAPVYWLGPPGAMKNFIDRSHGHYRNQSLLQGKQALLISVATDSGFDSHEAIMGSWLRVYGAEIVAAARVLACEKGEVLRRPAAFEEVRRVAELALASHQGPAA